MLWNRIPSAFAPPRLSHENNSQFVAEWVRGWNQSSGTRTANISPTAVSWPPETSEQVTVDLRPSTFST